VGGAQVAAGLVAPGKRLAKNSFRDKELEAAIAGVVLAAAEKSAPGNPKGLGCEDFGDKSPPPS
jgi:hypothetical protein